MCADLPMSAHLILPMPTCDQAIARA